MTATELLDGLAGGLVVSCQALPDEPMYRPDGGVMPLFAQAAQQAGAIGIRANSVRDIRDIKTAVDLPLIGIIKRQYEPHEPYITVTMREVDALAEVGADIIALELTSRQRPDGLSVADWVAQVRERHPDQLLMADVATFEEGVAAAQAGAHLVGTTLSGYTDASHGAPSPNVELVRDLVAALDVPVVAEGGVHMPEQARQMLDAGAHCVVVGGAITRPLEIARRFVAAIK